MKNNKIQKKQKSVFWPFSTKNLPLNDLKVTTENVTHPNLLFLVLTSVTKYFNHNDIVSYWYAFLISAHEYKSRSEWSDEIRN